MQAPTAPTLVNESSDDSRLPNPATANYSNVQIVCRINAPNKAPQNATAKGGAGIKRPSSASRIHFHSNVAGPCFKSKEHSTAQKNSLRVNPRSSFMSI